MVEALHLEAAVFALAGAAPLEHDHAETMFVPNRLELS
jgi:hypothetical protein